jgi:hypothetical protein
VTLNCKDLQLVRMGAGAEGVAQAEVREMCAAKDRWSCTAHIGNVGFGVHKIVCGRTAVYSVLLWFGLDDFS